MKYTTIILDRGHATLDRNGRYATPGKQFKFPDGTQVYEGYENQKYVERLAHYAEEKGFKVEYTIKPDSPLDISLADRVKRANSLPDAKKSIYVSVHNNAGGGQGTEVFTSKGQTKSDVIAEEIIDAISTQYPLRKMRLETSDGDKDKEENFYVLRHTSMPAVLLEYGFFDNREDYDWLSNPCTIELLAKATIEGIYNAVSIL